MRSQKKAQPQRIARTASQSDRLNSDGISPEVSQSEEEDNGFSNDLPTISLGEKALKTSWKVEKVLDEDEIEKFVVTGDKIEKFARRTDLNNYASVNRLRDIMKKLGIRAELTSLGAKPDSIISIAGKEFTFVEDW